MCGCLIDRGDDKEIIVVVLNLLFVYSNMQDELRQQKEEERDDYCSQVYLGTFFCHSMFLRVAYAIFQT